jgi:glutamine amidotransferase
LYDISEEDNVECLGIIPGRVTKFPSTNNLIVPHMGWNNLKPVVDDPILSGIYRDKLDSYKNDVYFVHSYYAPVTAATIASTEYGVNCTAITRHNNFYGMQFHPEKSGQIGSKLLENFVKLVR